MPRLHCPVEGCEWRSQDLEAAFAAGLTAALQIHDRTIHSTPAPVAPPKLKLDPPTIAAGCDPDQWSAFTRQWDMYKVGMAIVDNVLPTALFYCCNSDLRTDIMRDLQRDVATMAEADLLAAIKRLAVKDESILVHRIKLNKMTQSPGTGIRTFLAALRGQASLCQYKATCKEPGCAHEFDYSDNIIKDNLIRGIADPEIMSDLLGDPKTDRTLEETVSFIAQKEQGKVTKSAVGDSMGAMSTTRSYQRQTPVPGRTCWACGGPLHGQRNDRKARSKHCEAWTFTCGKCSTKGHYTKNCSKCTTCGEWGHRDSSSRACHKGTGGRNPSSSASKESTKNSQPDSVGYVFDQLCATTEQRRPEDKPSQPMMPASPSTGSPIEHHIFDGQWVPRPSKPHPMVLVRLTPMPEEHSSFGHPMKETSNLKPLTVSMVADTGCQSSVIPLQTANGLGVQTQDLIPVKLVMRGAIKEDLGIMGAIVINVTTRTSDESIRSTRLLCYVSNAMEQAFLCREALASLGIIAKDFPKATVVTPPSVIASTGDCEEVSCSCPRRQQEPPPMPTSLPDGLSATANNVEALKQWLLDYYGATTFNVCEHQPLPLMKCEPLRLHVDPSAVPVAIHKPALVPIHWQDQVYADLERDVRIGVLERVDPNTPTTWCSRMVVTSKADGTPRRTVDLQPQNRHSVRQTHHVPSPFHLADRVPQGTKKTVTDAWNGYHSVPICVEDRHITTFITPWGRYRYKVAPQGFMASGDAYNQRFDAIISDFHNKVKCVDDTCMWEDSIKAAFFQACEWLDLCSRNGITLNPKKFQFAQDIVDFAGLTITPTNIRPSAKFIDAIRNFPTPTDITGARAWFGLINQGAYAFAMTKQMQPFRALLKPSTVFLWTDKLDELFHRSKEVIIKEMKEGVRLFDPTRVTCLATDWSVDGIGFFMMQKYCQCRNKTPTCCQDGWKLCLIGSRFTHPAESRYAPIEGEALAVVYALHQTRYYVLGCEDLIVATDHKPLLQILNERSLTDISNRRLLNLKENTLGYRFTVVHVPGKKNLGPDAVSRHPTGCPERLVLPGESSDTELEAETTASCHDTLPCLYQLADDLDMADDLSTIAAATCALNAVVSVVTWDMVREATTSDPTFESLINFLESGFPDDCRELPAALRPYHRFAASLCVVDGVVLMGQRIVIPPALRQSVLNALHAAHQGVSAMRARAMDSVYWPDISIDIARTRDQCTHCHRTAKSNPMQPPSDLTLPDYPFQMICSDYFTFNSKDYVVIVDRYSNWPMVYRSESGAEGLVKRLRETFVTFGIPEELTSDGGPQFTSGKTQEFLKAWGVRHRISSVANPHANCRAELAVKSVKRMLMDNVTATGSLDVDKFQRALLMYRNSVDPETKVSPALILFGRPIRDAIPIPMGRYTPHETWTELLSHRELALARRHSRDHERWNEHTRRLPPLQTGDHVYVQNLVGNHPRRWERTGTVVEVRQYHQYVIRMDGTGRVTIRNRQHLRKFTPFHAPSTPGLSSTPNVERSGEVTNGSTPVTATRPTVSLPTTPPGDLGAPVSPGTDPTGTTNHERQPGMPSTPSSPEVPHTPLDHGAAPPRGSSSGPQRPLPTCASTPKSTDHLRLNPQRLSFGPPNQQTPTPIASRVPRALARLLPHNQAGTVRPPPPTYSDALAYPSSKQQKQQQHQQSQQRDSKLNGKKVTWQTSLSHQDAVTPITDTVNNCTADKEPIYQTLPGESTYLKYGDTGSHYINIDPETSGKSKLVYSIKKTASGKPLIVLEAIPVTLASSKENMGVKTYAQLEVVAAGSQREGELMCGVGGVTTTTTTGCSGEVRTNGKAVLVPINGTIAPDRMIVDALLNECVRNESLNEELSNGDTRNHSDRDTGDSEVTEAQLNRDVASLTRALSQEDDEKSSQSEEQTPLLQNENAQITFTVENGECSFDRCQERHKDNSKSGRDKQRCDCYECTHNAKFSDCTCMEFKEHVTEQSTDHVTSVIYSEPEYSSSDVSIKCTGAEATCAASRKAENCQKTLKRTHNGVDHTVYELSPSDSFYSSADNVQGAGKGGGASSLESSEGISKLGQSSSSLPEAQTPSQRSRQPLNRETSVSFKKPLVVGPSESTSGGTRGGAEVTSKDSVVIAGDAEPLVTPSNQRTDSSETIPSNLILEDTRTYYNRKAADRGTLYCAAGGITVVATIVFLLIYFS